MNKAYILPQDSVSIEKEKSKDSEPIFSNSAITGGTMGKANVKVNKSRDKKSSIIDDDYTIEFDSIQASRVEDGNKSVASRVQTPARGHPMPKNWHNVKKPNAAEVVKPVPVVEKQISRQNTPIL